MVSKARALASSYMYIYVRICYTHITIFYREKTVCDCAKSALTQRHCYACTNIYRRRILLYKARRDSFAAASRNTDIDEIKQPITRNI